jgi:hypothetical protein
MNTDPPSLRQFAAMLLLCVLAVDGVAAPICPACSKLDLPSSHPVAFNSADYNSEPNCDRDGCFCCGFQIVAPPPGPTLALAESKLVSEFSTALPGIPPVFALYRPPRR